MGQATKMWKSFLTFCCLVLFVFLRGAGDEPHALRGGSTAVIQRLVPNRSCQVPFEVLQYLWNFPHKQVLFTVLWKPDPAYKVGLLVTSPASRPLRSHISLGYTFRFSTHRIVCAESGWCPKSQAIAVRETVISERGPQSAMDSTWR